MLLFDSVTKRFGKRTIFEDIDLEIKPGEFVSIVGDSGAGKTTLLKLILKMEQPTEGAIFFRGKDLKELSNDDVQLHRRTIGCVFQDYKLLPNKTVFENVAFPLDACGYRLPHIMQTVPEALKAAGVTHVQDQLPDELSGGEAQRAALARAIVHKPLLILADEPTGNLDIENAKNVLKQLIKINMTGVAVLLTTHNKPLVDLVGQRVLHLKNAKLTSNF